MFFNRNFDACADCAYADADAAYEYIFDTAQFTFSHGAKNTLQCVWSQRLTK